MTNKKSGSKKSSGGSRAPGGGPRKMAEVEIMRRDALVLKTEGHLTFSEIGTRLGVTRQRAHQLFTEALQDVVSERRELAEYALDEELLLIAMEIRHMVEIAARPCDVCSGEAVTKVEVCPTCLGLKKDLGSDEKCSQCHGQGIVGDWCQACNRTGCFYDPDERMKAIDRIQRSSDRRAKLLGLYAAQKIELPFDRDFYADLERLPNEELDKELNAFMVGVSTGRASETPIA
jgi:hypothetical protein